MNRARDDNILTGRLLSCAADSLSSKECIYDYIFDYSSPANRGFSAISQPDCNIPFFTAAKDKKL